MLQANPNRNHELISLREHILRLDVRTEGNRIGAEPRNEVEARYVEEGTCNAIFPSDASKDLISSFMATLVEGMTVSNDPNTINESLSLNSCLILSIFDEMSKHSSCVSQSCDIGIVFKNGTKLMAKEVSITVSHFQYKELSS